jgi:hypothetical protein
LGIAIGLGVLLVGCVRTSMLAHEYRQQYVLTENVTAFPCETFTGQWSVLFSGPEKALCVGGARPAGELGTVLLAGSGVRVEKLFRIAAVDAFYDRARVSILDAQSGTERIVYSDWPELSKLLKPVR